MRKGNCAPGGCRSSKGRQLGLFSAFLWWSLTMLPASAASAAPLSAIDIVNRVDDLHRSAATQGRMLLSITTRAWQRTVSLEFWSKGQDRMLVKVLSPEKEKGTAVLRVGSQVWNYLPKVKRAVQVPAAMLSSPCLGSHFTYNDLVRVRRLAADYRCEISFSGQRGGQEVVEVTCIPKRGAPVVWGKVVILVRRADALPLKMQYHDESLALVRTLTFGDVRNSGGRLLPARLTVTPHDQPGESTVVLYQQITFDLPVSDQLFSLSHLKD